MKRQRIKTRCTIGKRLEIKGWLDDKRGTYLWFGVDDRFIGLLDGVPMYRLAKAIVKRWEADKT